MRAELDEGARETFTPKVIYDGDAPWSDLIAVGVRDRVISVSVTLTRVDGLLILLVLTALVCHLERLNLVLVSAFKQHCGSSSPRSSRPSTY